MRIRSGFAHVGRCSTVLAAPQLHAQRVIDLASDLLDRFSTPRRRASSAVPEDQLKEIDTKLKAFRECKKNYDIVAGAGGKTGLAARIALRAKCGASEMKTDS